MTEPVHTPRSDSPGTRGDTLALQQLMTSGGIVPKPDDPGPATNVVGMVKSLAFKTPAYGAPNCAGQRLRVDRNRELYAVIGNTYGGGTAGREFTLPDLRGRIAVGGEAGTRTGRALALTYVIAFEEAVDQTRPSPMVGSIGLFAGASAPAGWLVAAGARTPIAEYRALYETIGSAFTFGGDNGTYFCLPDLYGRAPVGVGDGVHLPVSRGQLVHPSYSSTATGGLGLNFIIAVDGYMPFKEGNGDFPHTDPVLGEVAIFAGASIPSGWQLCDGRLLNSSSWRGLFELLGTTYGGDGDRNFALPDLRGRMLVGT